MDGEQLAQFCREAVRADGDPRTPVEARAERLERVLRGDAALPIGRFVTVARQEGDEGAPNGEAFHVRIRASTDGLARDGGVIPLAAWEDGGLERFRRNPVVMLSHGWGFPLGISVFDELDADERALVSFWRFHEESEESKLARRLYEGGFMRAASVGFAIHAWHEPDEDELEQLREQENVPESVEIRWVADEAELLEESAVAVPADPGALTTTQFGRAVRNARAHGMAVGPLERRMAQMREACRNGDGEACDRLEAAKMGRDGSGTDGQGELGLDGGEREDARASISFKSAHDAGSYEVADRDAEWDAADEVAQMEADEDVLRPRHALVDDDGDPETKSAYGFPHHRADAGMAVVFRALAQGFARLDQADATEAEKDGVAEHLGRHYRTDYDEEPPERGAVAAAVRAWPYREQGGDEMDARIAAYLEEHGTTLEKLGGGDRTAGAMVVAEAVAREDEGAAADPDPDAGGEEAAETAGEPAEGEGEAVEGEGREEDADGLETRVEALEEDVAEVREGVQEIRTMLAEDDEAGGEGEPADGEEGAGEADDPDPDDDEEHAAGEGTGREFFADEDWDVVEEDGERLLRLELDGEEVELVLEDGQEAGEVLDSVADRAAQRMREMRGAPVPRGGS